MLESFKSSNFEYKKLNEDEQQRRGILARLVGPIADYKNPTRNGRKYNEKLWEKVFSDPIVKERIDNHSLYGELGHPEDRLETDMSKICICLAEPPKKSSDGKLYGVFDVLDTPNGRILKTLLDYGTTIGVSSRGEGDLTQDYMGEEIVDPSTYQFECFDAVILPAVKSARLQPVNESLNRRSLKQALLEDIRKANDNDKLVMNDTLESLGIDLDEGIQYKGYDMTITRSGVQLRKTDGSFVREFPTEEEAREYVDEMTLNESLSAEQREKVDEISERYNSSKPVSGSWDTESKHELLAIAKELGISKRDALDVMVDYLGFDQDDLMDQLLKEEISDESSIKDVNIKKESEKEEADDDGADLVAELQETMLRNADLEKLVKSLQERLSVCYAKEKRYEGQVNTYKNSIKSLQENAKKATSLEGRVSSLQEELNSSKSTAEDKDQIISKLKESLANAKSSMKQQEADYEDSKEATKQVVEELMNKVQSLQEELEQIKSSKTTSIKVLKETYSKRESDLNTKLLDLQKDSDARYKQLQEKLARANDVAANYKDIAKRAVNKYITEKTNALAISADEVKRRLGKTYSFNDIDRICESLSSNRLAINNLPFKVSQVNEIKVTESKKIPSDYTTDGDYIDSQLSGLIDRLS